MMRIFNSLSYFILLLLLGACTKLNPLAVGGEVSSYRLGSLKESEEVIAGNLEVELPASSELQASASVKLPTMVDLSSNCPPVGDQGQQGSCVGWATAYALKTYEEIVEEKWSGTSKAHQFSPSWVYNQINGGHDEGSRISDALALIVKRGADTLDAFSYDDNNFTKKPDGRSYERAAHFKASRWASLPNDLAKIKKQLATGRALVIGIDVYESFMSLDASHPIYASTSGRLLGGHALCVVGYDDSKQALKFINSWSTKWGVKGYGYLTYDFIKPQSPIGFQAYVLYDKANVD